jgi:uncharacterized RDD family membrane protein YckC
MESRNHRAEDTEVSVQTPEGIEYALYPAGLPVRLVAYLIDSVFQWIIILFLMILFFALLHLSGGIWLLLLARFAVEWFYFVICEICFRGQSLGKRFLGIRVVSGDGSPVSPGASLVRNLLRFADNFLGLFLVAFLPMIYSRGFRRPGDFAADTLVIYTWQSHAPVQMQASSPLSWLSGVKPAVAERALSTEEKQGILMFARRYPLLGPARADEIAKPLAESLRGKASQIDELNSVEANSIDNGDGKISDSEFLLGIARNFEGGL